MKRNFTFLKILATTLVLLLLLPALQAQDGHYAQFAEAPIYTNPALTGIQQEGWRIGLNYRRQWAVANAPYFNRSAFVDVRSNKLGLGLLVHQNDAGEASMQRTQAGLAMALHKPLDQFNSQLSLGGMVGILQQRFDPAAFTYDQQFGANGFDPLSATGESFSQSNMILPDFNLGLQVQTGNKTSGKFGGSAGFSVAHINQAQASFYGDQIEYPLRTNMYAALWLRVQEGFTLESQILSMKQMTARELLMKVQAAYSLQNNKTILAGAGVRKNDAVILFAGLQFEDWRVGLSYDINTSGLKSLGKGSNAFEVSATIFIKEKARKVAPREAIEEPVQEVRKDSDGDGITDDNDLCPYQPGIAALQGCADSDGDKVWDHLDACPNIPGSPQNYGCPLDQSDLDSDGDGIKDKDDHCIYLRGTVKFSGCPDSDNDGLSDLEDECPYLHGEIFLRGCPAKDDLLKERRIVVEVVEFETSKAKIQQQYFPMLDRMIYELLFQPEFHLQIEGHTDSEGDALQNYQLSQQRAFAIQEYLIARGVSPDRISVMSYGESRPKADNEREDGKARNRRAELILFGK